MWYWIFNEGTAPYTTCFEVYVDVDPTNSPTTTMTVPNTTNTEPPDATIYMINTKYPRNSFTRSQITLIVTVAVVSLCVAIGSISCAVRMVSKTGGRNSRQRSQQDSKNNPQNVIDAIMDMKEKDRQRRATLVQTRLK